MRYLTTYFNIFILRGRFGLVAYVTGIAAYIKAMDLRHPLITIRFPFLRLRHKGEPGQNPSQQILE